MHSFKKLIFIVFFVADQRVQQFYNYIMCQVGSYRTVVGSYRMVE